MGSRTALYEDHVARHAKIVDFGGWDMPLHYGSQIEEHHQVRRHAGMFDVSHMTVVDVRGDHALSLLRRVLANDVAKLGVGRALYSVMLNDDAGIIDDLIAYREEKGYRVIVNCGTRDKDLAWLRLQAEPFGVSITYRDDLSIIAVQGPRAVELALSSLPVAPAEVAALSPFNAIHTHSDWLIARTGYTGEDGLEIVLPHAAAVTLWRELIAMGVTPAGLGARDTLRLEAGMCLYGQDMDETTHPLEANLAWTLAWKPEDREFIGRRALAKIRDASTQRRLIGIVLETKGVMRHGQAVLLANGAVGEVTSGIFSPTLGYSIGFARVAATVPDGPCSIDVRGKSLPARLVKAPFVRNGKQVFT